MSDRTTDVKVTYEPRTYRATGPHSWIADVGMVQLGLDHNGASQRRLEKHGEETLKEIEHRSREGGRALYEIRQLSDYPHNDAELRAATSSTLAGFTTPQYLLDKWAPFRGIHRTFVDQTDLEQIPETGVAMHVPTFTSAAADQTQTEGSAVTELDPSGADATQTVATLAGQITESMQIWDRALRGGGSFDATLYKEMREYLNQNTDAYAIQQAIAGGTAVAGQASYSNANLYTDLALAREVITDTAGVRFRPTHLFTTSDLYSFATRQVDTTNARPIETPTVAPGKPPFEDIADSLWWGFTGTIMPGTVFWFTDDNIPASGANTQIIMSRPDTVLTLEGEPTLKVAFDAASTVGNLQVIVSLYNYVCVIARHPAANAVLTSAAYPTSAK